MRHRRGSEASSRSYVSDVEHTGYSESSDDASLSGSLLSSGSDDFDTRSRRSGRSRRSFDVAGLLGIPGGHDVVFGESRIDIASLDEEGDSATDESFEEADAAAAEEEDLHGDDEAFTAHVRQSVYIDDEDLPVVLTGLSINRRREWLWNIGCVLSLGILWLVGRWLPLLWVDFVTTPGPFNKSRFILVQVPHHTSQVAAVGVVRFDRAMPLQAVFPESMDVPLTSREAQEESDDESSEGENPKPAADEGANKNPKQLGGKENPHVGIRMPTPVTKLPPVTPVAPAFVNNVRYIDYRYHRFLLHPDGLLRMIRDWSDSQWHLKGGLEKGISSKTASDRQSIFGHNVIDIEKKPLGVLFVDEVLHPFYVFQIMSIILWSLDSYYYYAFAIFVISIFGIVTTLIETSQNVERMRKMSRFVCEVSVLRDYKWHTLSSEELVPGDIVDVSDENLALLPSDMLLLTGDAIVNEAMLTGESIPVSKSPLPDDKVYNLTKVGGLVSDDLTKHMLFGGTKVVRIRGGVIASPQAAVTASVGSLSDPMSRGRALAMVFRTGFNTSKGSLVRSMLFPKPFGFAFYRDSFRFIGVLACVALVGFVISAFNFLEMGVEVSLILRRALDLVTIVVPPALPATMTVGISFAIGRLRKAAIYCISPTRINIAGKINMVCFDKTGTLTEEGLDVLGVRAAKKNSFTDLAEDINDVPQFPAGGPSDATKRVFLTHALATCHALTRVDGEIIGDPLDLKMFEFTRWNLIDSDEQESSEPLVTIVRPPGSGNDQFTLDEAIKISERRARFLELGIMRTFEFESSLRRMSVLVRRLPADSFEVYCKGAPESVAPLCQADSLPEDYDAILKGYAHAGLRVIAIAGKSLPDLAFNKAQKLSRDAAECDLRFLGFLIFENKVKSGTPPALATLANAYFPTRMCTGDNLLTAVSVARNCGLISYDTRVFIPRKRLVNEPDTQSASSSVTTSISYTWHDLDADDDDPDNDPYSEGSLNPYTLKPYDRDISSSAYCLAVSGDVFYEMNEHSSLETMQRMLFKTSVFARMSPENKEELVERLQSMGYVVGFCGDGANDCGALKAADVGLSLSEAEASVAAPFTSRQPDIRCYLNVIKEGRAALVTSFACFKFMALYSMIQFTTVTLLYAMGSNLGDFQFLYIDLALILPLAVTMGHSEAYPRIHYKRPTASLVSKKVLASLLGHVTLSVIFQAFVFTLVRMQPWYRRPEWDKDMLDIASYENTALFTLSSFQYIIVAIVFSGGPPYRKPISTNTWFLTALAALSACSLYLLFTTRSWFLSIFQLLPMPNEFHLLMVLIILANGLFAYLYETYWAILVAEWYSSLTKRYRRWQGRRKDDSGKIFKVLTRDMDE